MHELDPSSPQSLTWHKIPVNYSPESLDTLKKMNYSRTNELCCIKIKTPNEVLILQQLLVCC